MKKTILVSLASLILLLAGCVQPASTTAPTLDQSIDQPTAEVNRLAVSVDQLPDIDQRADSIIKWDSYQDSNFSVDYPAYLSQEVTTEGVRTTVSFQGGITQQGYDAHLSIASMPNQGGLTLDDWTDEVIAQSRWIKAGSLEISGEPAYLLTLPETDAGNRYVFLSKDGRTIFDMNVQHIDNETADLIIASFLLITSN